MVHIASLYSIPALILFVIADAKREFLVVIAVANEDDEEALLRLRYADHASQLLQEALLDAEMVHGGRMSWLESRRSVIDVFTTVFEPRPTVNVGAVCIVGLRRVDRRQPCLLDAHGMQ